MEEIAVISVFILIMRVFDVEPLSKIDLDLTSFFLFKLGYTN